MSLERPVQPERGKSAPLVPGAGFATGRGAGGSGAYVHTDRNIFPDSAVRSPQVFEGRTVDQEDRDRQKRRWKVVFQISDALYKAGQEEAGKRLLGCGRWFQRINFGCGTYRLVPYPCDSIFCPQCAARRSKSFIERILKRLDRSKHYWFLTITVQNWPSLTGEGISNLIRHFSELRETDEWKKYVAGGIYSVETTFNVARRDWHPHLHVLIETDERLPQSWVYRLRVLWRRITGSHVINLQPVYGIDRKGRKRRRINRSALCELVKYATKASGFSNCPDRVIEFYRAFANVRRVQAFGSFFGSVKEKSEEDDEKKQELVGCACGLCRWKDGTPAGLFHIFQTSLDVNGVRQLKLFEFDSVKSPPEPESPPALVVNRNLDLFFHQAELAL